MPAEGWAHSTGDFTPLQDGENYTGPTGIQLIKVGSKRDVSIYITKEPAKFSTLNEYKQDIAKKFASYNEGANQIGIKVADSGDTKIAGLDVT